MKGLLLKDWYMIKKYCRIYILLAAVFIAASLLNGQNMFFLFYPCLLCGMIPTNLLAYDESSRWIQYSGTLPFTKTQIVSGKYLIGLFSQLTMLIVSGIVQAIKMKLTGSFIPGDFAFLMLLTLTVSLFASSISLPFIFKLGVEKGRIAYYVMIGFVCGASVLASNLFQNDAATEIKPNLILGIAAVIGIGIYIFSWYLSIVFYEKREIG